MAPSTSCRRRCGREPHGERLWRALQTDQLSVVATDHCPFCMKEQKELGKDRLRRRFPNGAPGVETPPAAPVSRRRRREAFRPASLRADHRHRAGEDLRPVPAQGHHRASAATPIWCSSTPPARTRSASDPSHERRLQPLRGPATVQGRIVKVLSRGELIVDGDRWLGRAGRGQFIRSAAFPACTAARPDASARCIRAASRQRV